MLVVLERNNVWLFPDNSNVCVEYISESHNHFSGVDQVESEKKRRLNIFLKIANWSQH